MDVLERVKNELGIDQGRAERTLGMIFTSIRLSIDQPSFEHIKRGVPHVESWMGKSLVGGGGRTGEMVGLVGPQALERNLSSAGFSAADVQRLAAIVGSVVRELLPKEAVDALAAKMPIIKPS